MNEKESYESKKEEREQVKNKERNAGQRKRTMQRIRSYVIWIAVIGALGYGIYLLAQSSAPKGEDFSQAVPIMEVTHIDDDSVLPEYNSNPPTSGPHSGQTARSGFREEAIPDQNIIHNLEHGDVWIAYHPRISDEMKDELKQFSAGKVIITPREANDTDIALVAWGRLGTFNIENNVLPEERIKDFIKRYLNKGPERVTGASVGI